MPHQLRAEARRQTAHRESKCPTPAVTGRRHAYKTVAKDSQADAENSIAGTGDRGATSTHHLAHPMTSPFTDASLAGNKRWLAPLTASLILGAVAVDSALAQSVSTGAITSPQQLVVRAKADLAGGIGADMALRVNGDVIGTVQVNSTTYTDYSFAAKGLAGGSIVEVVFSNDAAINGADRNLHVAYVASGNRVVVAYKPGNVIDRGSGAAAFDGKDLLPPQEKLGWNSALKIVWPNAFTPSAALDTASRILQQATFGPTPRTLERFTVLGIRPWLNEQMQMPYQAKYVPMIQANFQQGSEYRPRGSKYDPSWINDQFWKQAATAEDQVRMRVAFALHNIVMVSLNDSNLWPHARAYAAYLDILHEEAFGNYRTLLERIAYSPAMGIYLSHMRNRPEDPTINRQPDENFARELLQLFSIGTVELNIDGTRRLDSAGNAVECYTNDDVMAVAKVFTGLSWAFPDDKLTEANFRWGNPDYNSTEEVSDLRPMRAYPGQHSTVEKRVFAGKPYGFAISAGGSAPDDIKQMLDGLFRHPNVAPFISKQLIQHLVTSNPSPSYVGRVARAFENDGQGVRGDMKAVIRAVLMDPENIATTRPTNFGRLREPALRGLHWIRAFSAKSSSGEYRMAHEFTDQSQRVFYAPSVFGYFRPTYVPPNSALSAAGLIGGEFQIANEATVAQWTNTVASMTGGGLGWANNQRDVMSTYDTLASFSASGDIDGFMVWLNRYLFAGQMSDSLRRRILDAITGVPGTTPLAHQSRARVAAFVALTSPEYLIQR